MFTVSFIGIGNRGGIYAKYFARNKDVKIVAGCDISGQVVKQLSDLYGVAPENLFTDEEKFFEKKRSDVLVIATLDGLHVRQAVKAMEVGYDILLEKPIAPDLEGTMKIAETAKRLNRTAVICHNLRYAPFYQKIKLLVNDGEIGEIVNIEQSENVAYFHIVSSFVRGKWRRTDETSPIILQKCCHDLDLIYWLIGRKCSGLSSYGSLRFYTEQNPDAYSVRRCVNCDRKDCAYNAVELYGKYPGMMSVPYGFDTSKENIVRYLSDESCHYGSCVFHSDNDVCDRQIVNMRFDGGASANLVMQGFAATTTDRITKIYGSRGAVYGNFNSGIVTLEKFGEKPQSFNVNLDVEDVSHNGGDAKLVRDYVDFMNGKGRALGISKIQDSVYSHLLAFKAEESRLGGGKIVKVDYGA